MFIILWNSLPYVVMAINSINLATEVVLGFKKFGKF